MVEKSDSQRAVKARRLRHRRWRYNMHKAVSLYAQGWRTEEIASELELDGRTIRKMFEEADKIHNLDNPKSIERYRYLACQTYLKNVRLAERSFFESRGEHTKTKITTSAKGDSEEQTIEQLAGDPRYLAEIRQSTDAFCRLLGLNAPADINVNSTTSKVTTELRQQMLDDDELREDWLSIEERMLAEDDDDSEPTPDDTIIDVGGSGE